MNTKTSTKQYDNMTVEREANRAAYKTPSTAADKTAHTPGPWIFGSGGDLTLRVWHNKQVICQFGEGIDESRDEHKNAEANARLIAAAPDLLAACKRFVDYYDQPNRVYQLGNGNAAKFFYEIKSVISKAEGRAQ